MYNMYKERNSIRTLKLFDKIVFLHQIMEKIPFINIKISE